MVCLRARRTMFGHVHARHALLQNAAQRTDDHGLVQHHINGSQEDATRAVQAQYAVNVCGAICHHLQGRLDALDAGPADARVCRVVCMCCQRACCQRA